MRRYMITIPVLMFITNGFMPVQATAQDREWSGNDAGMQTLGDLLTMNTKWFTATIDDATIQFTRNGLAGPGGAWWPVFLNGTRMDLNVWDTKSMHMLPVTLAQVDSVVLVDKPGLHHGTFIDKGAVFIYTDPPKEGLKVKAGIMQGNKSGDPGPFVYTGRAVRNLERLGPVANASVSYSKNGYVLEAGFKHFVHSVSDPLQYRRITPLEFGTTRYRHPKITGDSFYLSGSRDTKKLRNRLQLGGSAFTDFLFTGLYGTEIPVDRKWVFASLDGSAKLNDQLSVNYHVKRSLNDVEEYPNKDNRWLRWEQGVTTGQVSIEHTFGNGVAESGIGVDAYSLKDEAGGSGRLTTALFRAFNRLQIRMSDRLTLDSHLTGVKGDGEGIALKAHAGLSNHVHPNHKLSLGLSYSERFPEEDNSLWYWMADKGFGGDTLAPFRPLELENRIRFLEARVGWTAFLGDWIDLKTGITVSRNEDEYLLQYTLGNDGRRTFTESYDFINDLDATFLEIPLRLMTRPAPGLHQTVSYTWRRGISGDTGFWEMAPAHRLNMYTRWRPAESFEVWTKVHFRSQSSWQSASSLDGVEVNINPEQTVTYYPDMDSRFQWDVGISKALWSERILFSLDALNILNEKYRNHPLGPNHTFSIFFRLSMELPG